MRTVHRIGVVLAAVVSIAPTLRAHEDPNDRIHALTHLIAKHPGDAAVYLERGRLYHVEGEWTVALADLDTVIELRPGLAPKLQVLRSEALLGAGRSAEALKAADAGLAAEPANAAAQLARARALVQLDRPGDAVAAYTKAIETLTTPSPDHYLERARAATDAGEPERALQGLEEGIGCLGHAVALEMAAVDLECVLGRHDDALARVARLNDRARRKEHWLVLRGEILDDAGRTAEATAAYFAALEAMERLPAGLRSTEAAQKLQRQAQDRLLIRVTNWCDPLP